MSNTLHDLGQDASKLARERILDPAKNLIAEARTTLQHETQQAQSILKADARQAKESLVRLRRQSSDWIAAHPLTSVSLALLAGVAMGTAARSVRL